MLPVAGYRNRRYDLNILSKFHEFIKSVVVSELGFKIAFSGCFTLELSRLNLNEMMMV